MPGRNGSPAIRLYGRLFWAQWRAHAARQLLLVLAIALGVTMAGSIFLINQSALAEFARASGLLSGQADLQLRGPGSGFDESLYARVAALPEVAEASPWLEHELPIAGQDQTLHVIGIDVFRAMHVTPGLVGQISPTLSNAQLLHLDPDAVFLSPAALQWLGLTAGDRLMVAGRQGPVQLRVAGTLDQARPGQRLAVMDIAAVQWRLTKPGRLHGIDLRLRSGHSTASFKTRLQPLLPVGVTAQSPQQTTAVGAELSRAYRVNLNILALVALLTGAFLVFSAQALSLVARQPQFALLRALGMESRQVQRLVLLESLILGLVGSVLGILASAGVASVALAHGVADLGGGYFTGLRPSVQLSAELILLLLLLGIGAACLAGWAPARNARHIPVALALRGQGWPARSFVRGRRVWLPPLLLAGLALGLGLLPPLGSLPLGAYGASAVLLILAVGWTPRLLQQGLMRLPRPRRLVFVLAAEHLSAGRSFAVMGFAGVLVSFSLMVAMATMVHSFRVSFDHWLDAVLPAPLYVRSSTVLNAEQQTRLAALPGVSRVEFNQHEDLQLDPDLPPVDLLLRSIDDHKPGTALALVAQLSPADAAAVVNETAEPPVWVSEAMVSLYGARLGELLYLPVAGERHAFRVMGIWRDYARQFGAVVLSMANAQRLGLPVQPSEASLWPAEDVRLPELAAALHDALGSVPGLQVRTAGEIRERSQEIFERSFALTYWLEAIAVLVGVLGVQASFAMQALLRAREFGMLRHIGLLRSQLMGVLLLEGGLLGIIGTVAGLALGLAQSWILVHLVNPQSFRWTMDMIVPWSGLLLIAMVLVLASALAALLGGRRVLGMAAIRAVRVDG